MTKGYKYEFDQLVIIPEEEEKEVNNLTAASNQLEMDRSTKILAVS